MSVPVSQWKVEWLLDEPNAELRRVLLREVGYSRIMQEIPNTLIHSDRDMELRRIDAAVDVEPITLLKVTCPSTGAFYTLRVPPDSGTCEAARAWTFGEEAIEYLVET